MASLRTLFKAKTFFNFNKNLGGLRSMQTKTSEATTDFAPFMAQTQAFNIANSYPITSGLNVKIDDKPGSLKKILEIFETSNINLTDIQSKTLPLENSAYAFNFFFNDDKACTLTNKLKKTIEQNLLAQVEALPQKNIPWFPQSESDLMLLNSKTVSREEMLGVDHPGVNDPEYIKRRDEIAVISSSYKSGPLPFIEYTDAENATWNLIFPKLHALYKERACNAFLNSLEKFMDEGIYTYEKIPQMRDVSDHLTKKTGFKLKPVTGLLDPRDFLNALAFKCFYATQYLRHPSKPFYTPEPDLIHELLGHSALLADKDFAEFTQLLGLASLGASDEQIKLLEHLYWYTNEFGLLFEDDKLKAYGAGVLSSVAELDFATRPTNNSVKIYDFSPSAAAKQPFEFTDIQNTYYAAKSLGEIRDKCHNFTQEFLKPFQLKYCADTNSVKITTSVKLMPLAMQF